MVSFAQVNAWDVEKPRVYLQVTYNDSLYTFGGATTAFAHSVQSSTYFLSPDTTKFVQKSDMPYKLRDHYALQYNLTHILICGGQMLKANSL